MVSGESDYFMERRYRLNVIEQVAPPQVRLVRTPLVSNRTLPRIRNSIVIDPAIKELSYSDYRRIRTGRGRDKDEGCASVGGFLAGDPTEYVTNNDEFCHRRQRQARSRQSGTARRCATERTPWPTFT
jgi:hypothetical protein